MNKVNDLRNALIQGIEAAGFSVSGPTDVRAAEHGEPAWVCNGRAAIADSNQLESEEKAKKSSLCYHMELVDDLARQVGSWMSATSDDQRSKLEGECVRIRAEIEVNARALAGVSAEQDASIQKVAGSRKASPGM